MTATPSTRALPVLGGAAAPIRSLPILGSDVEPIPAPPLYESRRGSHALIIDPRSGRWWIGSEDSLESGRDEVQRLAAVPSEAPEYSYDEYPAMLAVVKNKDCNLECTYCFAEADHTRLYQSADYLSKLFHRILATFPNKQSIVFLFSGGEPLIHFKTIRATVQRFCEEIDPAQRARITFGVMSNGTPINREMASFFREYGFNVCVSIDGPAEIHDRNRPLTSGKGSHAMVERKLDLLTEYGIAYSTICTIVYPDDLIPAFEYQLSRGRRNLYMRPLRMQGRQMRSGELKYTDDEHVDYQLEMATEFLRLADRICQYNLTHDDRVVEQTIVNHMRHVTSQARNFMCLKGPCGAGCGAKLGIDWNGNLFPCDTLVEFPELQIASADQVTSAGNFSDLFEQSPVLAQMSGRKAENILECSTCHVQQYCGGGCSATSYETHGDLRSPSDRCEYERAFFEGLLWKIFDNPQTVPLLLGQRRQATRAQWSRPGYLELCTGGGV